MSKRIAQPVGDKRIAWLLAIVAAFAVFATIATQFDGASAAEMPQASVDRFDAADYATLNSDDSAPTVDTVVHPYVSEPGSLTGRLESAVTYSASLIRAESAYSMGNSDGGTVHYATMRDGELTQSTGNPGRMSIAGDDANLSGSDLNNSTVSAAPTSNPLAMVPVNVLTRLSGEVCWTACKVNAQTKTITVDSLGVSTYSSFVPPGAANGTIVDEYVQLVQMYGGQTVEFIDPGPADLPSLLDPNSVSRASPAFIPSASWSDRVGQGTRTGISPSSSFTAGGGTEVRASSSSAVPEGRDVAAFWLYAALGLGALAFGVGGTAVARRSR